MAGRADAMAERMAAVGDSLADVVERGAEALADLDPPTDAAGVEKLMRSARATALAGRGVLALTVDAARVLDAAEAEETDEDDDEEELDAAGLEALRWDVARRYARFDRLPEGSGGDDLGDAAGGAQGGAEGLGAAGARPPAAAA